MNRKECTERLIELGAHLVRCGADKKAFDQGWQKNAWDGEGSCRLVAHIPGRAGHCVIDIDTNKALDDAMRQEDLKGRYAVVREAFGRPAFRVGTPSGGLHVYYRMRDTEPHIGNMKLPDIGDVRCDAGYVVFWHGSMMKLLGSMEKMRKGGLMSMRTRERMLSTMRRLRTKGVEEAPKEPKERPPDVDPERRKNGGRDRKGDRNRLLFARVRTAWEKDPDPVASERIAIERAVVSGLGEEAVQATVVSGRMAGLRMRKVVVPHA